MSLPKFKKNAMAIESIQTPMKHYKKEAKTNLQTLKTLNDDEYEESRKKKRYNSHMKGRNHHNKTEIMRSIMNEQLVENDLEDQNNFTLKF